VPPKSWSKVRKAGDNEPNRSRAKGWSPHPYTHHRFPAEIISHGVWRYCCFCLSYHDGEELLCGRGSIVTYEAPRQWGRKVGHRYADQRWRRRPRPGDTWHFAEVLLSVDGERRYLWRAVNQDGKIRDVLVHRRRDQSAAMIFFDMVLKGVAYVPRGSARTSLQATARRSGTSCLAWNIATIAISTSPGVSREG